ncbi:MAG: acyl-CoA thioesterase [Kiritimatiellia bacterium]
MKHATCLTVRPYECDSYGHVNHAVYVNYLEHARMQFLHAAGFDYKGLIAAGFFTVIARLDISYRSPAYADDALEIETESTETRRIGGTFRQTIRRGETVVAEADVHWCVVDGKGRPARPPEKYDLRRLWP